MSPNFQLPPEALNQMLKMASQKLGTTPQELQKQLQNGNLDQLKNSNPNLNAMLSDPQKLQQMMNNPQMQQMLNKFGKK